MGWRGGKPLVPVVVLPPRRFTSAVFEEDDEGRG